MTAKLAYRFFFGGLVLKKKGEIVDRIDASALKAEMTPMQFAPFNKTTDIYLTSQAV